MRVGWSGQAFFVLKIVCRYLYNTQAPHSLGFSYKWRWNISLFNLNFNWHLAKFVYSISLRKTEQIEHRRHGGIFLHSIAKEGGGGDEHDCTGSSQRYTDKDCVVSICCRLPERQVRFLQNEDNGSLLPGGVVPQPMLSLLCQTHDDRTGT